LAVPAVALGGILSASGVAAVRRAVWNWVVTAYEASEWSDLFVATAGASAALAGLVFVAISINIERILKLEGIPERGLETVVLLVAVLVVSVIGLIPGQGHVTLGIELLVLALLLGGGLARLPAIRVGSGEPEAPSWLVGRWIIRYGGALLLALGSLSVLAAAGGGLYWVVAGIVVAVIGAVANAWVLLVEILR
jgi:hypothetical protein